MESDAQRIVRLILKELGGRGGFNGWWDGIDVATQREIRRTLETITEGVLAEGGEDCPG